MEKLLWRVYSADSELLAATTYAFDAAALAYRKGCGATVRRDGRIVFTAPGRSKSADDFADAAEVMRRAVYGDVPPRQGGRP